ncbi:MAG: class I SAM-dependent methyltransferase [Burkholderiaceae bacterium]|nr:class I SAM-dependent methyltransferase [Burkholderiaceae bacterium]
MLHDPWLDRWLAVIAPHAQDAAVLELGCGSGHDTATLTAAGFTVVAVEIDPASVSRARKRAPNAQVVCQDLLHTLPKPPAGPSFGAIIASLSLHYFPWEETVRLVARMRHALRPHGVLVCRLNSTEDRHFGAVGHRELEPNYYMVNGSPKRFFDEPAVDRLFSDGWHVRSKSQYITHKYVLPKSLWEVVLERDA